MIFKCYIAFNIMLYYPHDSTLILKREFAFHNSGYVIPIFFQQLTEAGSVRRFSMLKTSHMFGFFSQNRGHSEAGI